MPDADRFLTTTRTIEPAGSANGLSAVASAKADGDQRLEEGLNVSRVETACVRLLHHERHGVIMAERVAIGPPRRQRVVDIDDPDDLRKQRDLVATEAVRISASVDALVVSDDDRPNGTQRLQRRARERVGATEGRSPSDID